MRRGPSKHNLSIGQVPDSSSFVTETSGVDSVDARGCSECCLNSVLYFLFVYCWPCEAISAYFLSLWCLVWKEIDG